MRSGMSSILTGGIIRRQMWSTLEQAFAVPARQGYVPEVLLFDKNYALKHLIKVE